MVSCYILDHYLRTLITADPIREAFLEGLLYIYADRCSTVAIYIWTGMIEESNRPNCSIVERFLQRRCGHAGSSRRYSDRLRRDEST